MAIVGAPAPFLGQNRAPQRVQRERNASSRIGAAGQRAQRLCGAEERRAAVGAR